MLRRPTAAGPENPTNRDVLLWAGIIVAITSPATNVARGMNSMPRLARWMTSPPGDVSVLWPLRGAMCAENPPQANRPPATSGCGHASIISASCRRSSAVPFCVLTMSIASHMYSGGLPEPPKTPRTDMLHLRMLPGTTLGLLEALTTWRKAPESYTDHSVVPSPSAAPSSTSMRS